MSERIATIYDYVRLKNAVCDKGMSCAYCPLGIENNGENVVCNVLLARYTDKANKIILKWCDENPEKTYTDDFLEKFPTAILKDGSPCVCRDYVYGIKNHDCKADEKCKDCWNEVYE